MRKMKGKPTRWTLKFRVWIHYFPGLAFLSSKFDLFKTPNHFTTNMSKIDMLAVMLDWNCEIVLNTVTTSLSDDFFLKVKMARRRQELVSTLWVFLAIATWCQIRIELGQLGDYFQCIIGTSIQPSWESLGERYWLIKSVCKGTLWPGWVLTPPSLTRSICEIFGILPCASWIVGSLAKLYIHKI